MRVLIVAAAALHREGLVLALGHWSHIQVVGAAASVADALILLQASRPEIALLDVPQEIRLEGARDILRAGAGTQIVALVSPHENVDLVASAGAGIMGCQSLDGHLTDLVHLLERVARGEFAGSALAAGRLARRLSALVCGAPQADPPVDQSRRLTPREREVAGMLERGLSNKAIARELVIELATVKNHVHSILDKLCVSSRGAAVAALAPPGGRRPPLDSTFRNDFDSGVHIQAPESRV